MREPFQHAGNRFVELRESNPSNLKQMSCMKKDQNEILGFANVRWDQFIMNYVVSDALSCAVLVVKGPVWRIGATQDRKAEERAYQ